MGKTEIRSKVISALSKIYVFIDESEDENVNLESYIEDSIQFMSFIVELEEIFDVEIPAELLHFDNFKMLDDTCAILEELLEVNAA